MSLSIVPPAMAWIRTANSDDDSSSVDDVSLPDSAIVLSEGQFTFDSFVKPQPKPANSKKTVTIRLPTLYSSIMAKPARLNPHWNTIISQSSDEWARDVMKLSDKAFARHCKGQMTLLAAGFVPDADAHCYRIMCDFMEWVFFFDDMFDEGCLREDPFAAREEIEAHLAIHSPTHHLITPEENPVRHMYQVLWKKIEAISSSGAQQRYIQGMRHYFEGCLVQVDAYHWHSKGFAATTFDWFWRGRTHSVGCRPCQALLEPMYNITLPDHVWMHPMIKEAEDTATYITFLHNDIFSYRKEQGEPDAVPHNTVFILQRERGYTVQEAFDFADELLKQAFQRWHWAQQHMPSWGGKTDIQVQRYLEGLLDQAKANLHWSFDSGRYFGKDSEKARKTMTIEMPIEE